MATALLHHNQAMIPVNGKLLSAQCASSIADAILAKPHLLDNNETGSQGDEIVHRIHVSDRELASILAALHHLARNRSPLSDETVDLATGHDTLKPLSTEEIGDLFERLDRASH